MEYHGWAVIRGPGGEVPSQEVQELVYAALREARSDVNVAEGKLINAQVHVWVSGAPNHRGREFQDVLSLFERIATIARASYGLLNVWDDEAEQLGNEFQVYVLRRGTLRVDRDPFLSPCVPVIDDPEVEP